MKLQQLEERLAPAIFVVSNVNDSGAGSLRQAILDADAATGAQSIVFDSVTFASIQTITPLSALPTLTNTITIDATTLPTYKGTPLVEINGASAGNASGLVVNADNSIIKGLEVDRFSYFGIVLHSNGNTIQNDDIGVSGSGNTAAGNKFSGVFISGNNNVIRNDTISANAVHGVQIQNGASGNTVAGNMIGVGADGTTALGNTYDGVVAYLASPNNTIGGTAAADRNIIANNNRSGVLLLGPGTTGNQVNGNFIGTDVTGNTAEGNGIGVWLLSSTGNTVGNNSGSSNNTISGNQSSGVQIDGSNSNLISGNLIGVNQSGAAALGNKGSGLLLKGSASSNSITGNTISANGIHGVEIRDSGTSGNVLMGNRIGLNLSGSAALGNSFDGVSMYLGASSNTLGAGNIISGNGRAGVTMTSPGTTGNAVSGSSIGVDSAGTTKLGNPIGVWILGGAAGNTVGGSILAARNVIGGSSNSGILVSGSGTTANMIQINLIGLSSTNTAIANATGVLIEKSATSNTLDQNVISGNSAHGVDITDAGTSGNVLTGNFIGTNTAGAAALANTGEGVLIGNGAAGNRVGGTVASARNTISGNTTGVAVIGSVTANNVIVGNYIGTDVTGKAAIANSDGVNISSGAHNTTIGGTTVSARNVISGNTNAGVVMAGTGTTSNTIQGNYIGVQVDGVTALGNVYGVFISASAANNTIGGKDTGGNIIANNSRQGVVIGSNTSDSKTIGNAVLGNSIYSNGQLGIDLANDGVTANTSNGSSTGPNRLENYPLLQSAVASGTTLTVQGFLNSFASTTFRIEFFANATQDASGHGQGKTYLGFVNVTTNSSHNASFTATLTLAAPPPAGTFISATATDSSNNTSEFAQNIVSA